MGNVIVERLFSWEVFMSENKMTTNEVIKLLLNKWNEITSELLWLGYDSKRGEECVRDLMDSIRYTVDDIERILNR